MLCRRIAHELMLSVTLKATLNKASLSFIFIFAVAFHIYQYSYSLAVGGFIPIRYNNC